MAVIVARELVRRVVREAGIEHPVDGGMSGEELRDTQRVLAVALHAQGQRLQPLQEEPAIERTDRRPEVAQAVACAP